MVTDYTDIFPKQGDAFDFDEVHEAVARLRTTEIFFIGGSPKSGTTWLQVMLNAHPQINCRGEGHFINRLAPQLDAAIQGYNKTIEDKNRIVFGKFGGFPQMLPSNAMYLLYCSIAVLLLQVQRQTPAKRLLGEKTPDNVRHFPFLNQMFPHARFIHVVRDGRDCATSGWFHNRRLEAEGAPPEPTSFESYAEQFSDIWMRNVQDGMRFGALHPDRTLGVRYEDLVRAPEEAMQRLLQFLAVDATPDLVETCIAAGRFETLSGGRRPGEEDRTSFFRRGLPGDWQRHFTPQAAASFVLRAGVLLTMLGYNV